MKVDIICPLYNAENYIEKLHKSILKQKNVEINQCRYIVTKSSDRTEEILKELEIDYELIEKKEFSHSLTREKQAMKISFGYII